MRKITSQKTPSTLSIRSYTSSKNSLSTIVDKQTMEQVYRDLENPPVGTASLNKLLQEIDCEKQS